MNDDDRREIYAQACGDVRAILTIRSAFVILALSGAAAAFIVDLTALVDPQATAAGYKPPPQLQAIIAFLILMLGLIIDLVFKTSHDKALRVAREIDEAWGVSPRERFSELPTAVLILCLLLSFGFLILLANN